MQLRRFALLSFRRGGDAETGCAVGVGVVVVAAVEAEAGVGVGVAGGEGGGVVVDSRSFPPLVGCRGNAARTEMVEAIAAITPFAVCRRIPKIPQMIPLGDMREKKRPAGAKRPFLWKLEGKPFYLIVHNRGPAMLTASTALLFLLIITVLLHCQAQCLSWSIASLPPQGP